MAETNYSGPVNSEAGLLSGPFTEATAPTDPTVGQLAYFSDLGGSATWAQWDGSAWSAVGSGGGGGGMTIIELTDANKWATFSGGTNGNPAIQLPQMNTGETIRIIQPVATWLAEQSSGDVFLWKVDAYGLPGPENYIDIQTLSFIANNPDPYPVQFFSYNGNSGPSGRPSLYLYKGGVFEGEGQWSQFYVDIIFLGTVSFMGSTVHLYRIISPGYIQYGYAPNWGSNPLDL